MKSLNRFLSAFVILILAYGCASPVPPTNDKATGGPDIRGTITRVAGDTLVVEENPSEQSGSLKANVEVTESTLVRTSAGGPMTRSGFREGQIVSVWFTGRVLESYPVRATAEKIIVER